MLKEKHNIHFNLPCVTSRISIEGTELNDNKQQLRSSQILGCKINQRQIAKGRQKAIPGSSVLHLQYYKYADRTVIISFCLAHNIPSTSSVFCWTRSWSTSARYSRPGGQLGGACGGAIHCAAEKCRSIHNNNPQFSWTVLSHESRIFKNPCKKTENKSSENY